MTNPDFSTEALLTRKTVAEIALCENSCQHDLTPYLIDTELSLECIGHIAANSPDVVIATIDELLRLREENERLKEGLENALHVNELRLAEIAKTLITGLAEGITGDSKSVTSQIRATCVHCNASFTRAEEATAHDNVCPKHPANIRAGRLEKEIDWLAQAAANCEWMGRRVSPKFMREAARRAVESADE
ncbi:hypothetical protein HMPREF0326_03039 [Desulfovibrio sp. 3_1_syn3]|uniref:hypothetical protein n=1 Tax=Desulfovibrio sp. 3_1_syn3 TaxID=457398 RepID=UPI0001E12D83|nr:hypothetical protein [Desulfovibrio sp. 3_1_syn3]EFL84346.1 hypothetical protein HMPREF0326_03039 [Desulfovibrio sp. 3_1_syn3]